MLLSDSIDLTGEIGTWSEVVPSELFEKAAEYGKDDYLEHPSHSGFFYVNASNHLGKKVTAARAKTYEASLTENIKLAARETISTFCEKYHSLHKLQYDHAFNKGVSGEDGQWVCDCKGFQHSVGCSHALFIGAVHGQVDVGHEVGDISQKKSKGRKRKPKRGLEVQDEED